MTKNEKILFELLKAVGKKNVADVYYQTGFTWLPDTGWWAIDYEEKECFLGKTYEIAKANIELDKVQL